MSFSPSLTFFLDRMQGYSTNIFKLESHSKDEATAGDVIVFDMPSNAIINLRSFKVFFNANASTVAGKGARLPPVRMRCVEEGRSSVVLATQAPRVSTRWTPVAPLSGRSP